MTIISWCLLPYLWFQCCFILLFTVNWIDRDIFRRKGRKWFLRYQGWSGVLQYRLLSGSWASSGHDGFLVVSFLTLRTLLNVKAFRFDHVRFTLKGIHYYLMHFATKLVDLCGLGFDDIWLFYSLGESTSRYDNGICSLSLTHRVPRGEKWCFIVRGWNLLRQEYIAIYGMHIINFINLSGIFYHILPLAFHFRDSCRRRSLTNRTRFVSCQLGKYLWCFILEVVNLCHNLLVLFRS